MTQSNEAFDNNEKEYSIVELSGIISKDPVLVCVDGRYSITYSEVDVERASGKHDKITLNFKRDVPIQVGTYVNVGGTLRTYKGKDGKCNTVVLVQNTVLCPGSKYNNDVELQGRLFSKRETETANGVKVCEARIEIAGNYNKMSRVTVVGWANIAETLLSYNIGDTLSIKGILQSRIIEGAEEERLVLEVAITYLERVKQAEE